jgi:hypothetical protein
MVTKKRKTTKRKTRKAPVDEGIASMERTMNTTIKTVGTIAVVGMGIGLVGGLLGGMGK